VVYPNRMAKVDSIQDLQESSPRHVIIAQIVAPFSDAEEQITFGTELKNNESTVLGIHYLDQ